MADIQSNIRVNIDTSDALASIKTLQRQISAFQKQLRTTSAANAAKADELQRSLINDINASGKFAARLQTIKSTSEGFTTALEKNKLSMGEYFKYGASQVRGFSNVFSSEFNTIEKVARERVKTLQTQYISLGRDANGALKSISVRPLSLDMDNLATRQAIAAQRQQIFNQLLKQGSTNLLNFGKNTQWAGRQLMVGFTIPLSIFGGMATKTFMQLEEQAIRFKRVYGELFTPPDEADQMLDQLKELSLEFSKYGVSVENTLGLAADAAAMGKMGVELTAQVAEATRLAVLGGVDQQEALQTTISLTNAFGTSTEELANKIDFLNAVENQTVVSIEDLTIAIPKAGPVVKALGGDVEDLAFFLTAMKEGGINASEGANALKSGLARMINPTQRAKDMLGGLGINITKIVEDNAGDIKQTVLDLATALDALDPLNRSRAIEKLFGRFQFARLSTLFKNVVEEGNQASRVLELTNATTSELAQLSSRELARVEESATFRLRGAIEQFQAALAPIGEEFAKLVTPIIDFGTKVLNAFNNLSDGAKRSITTIVTVLGAVAPVALMTFGLLANGVANMIKGFTFVRSTILGFGRDTSTLGTQIDYMTQEQLEAASVAASLDQTHMKLTQTFTSERAAVDSLTSAYNRAVQAGSRLRVAPIQSNLGRGGQTPKFADGGIVRGPGTGTSDSIIARISNGEAIIPAASVKANPDMVNALVANNIPGFAEGRGSGLSIYGGQSLRLSGLGIMAPGNTPGSKFGMDKSFFSSGAGFEQSMLASAIAGGAVLDNPKVRMTQSILDEYSRAVADDVPRIVSALRETAVEMEKAGENTDRLEDITAKSQKKLEAIFRSMESRGGKAASSAKAMREHLFFPTESAMGGQFGETRAPGARESRSTGRVKSTMYRIGGSSPFQSRTQTAYRMITGSAIPGNFTYAHANEARMLGEMIPLAGGGMSLTGSRRAALESEINRRSTSLQKDYRANQIVSREIGRTGRATAEAAVKGFNDGFQNASPSKRMYQAGQNAAQGAINALNDSVDDMQNVGQKLGNAVTSGVGSQSARRATAMGKFDVKSNRYMNAEKLAQQEQSRERARQRMAQASVNKFAGLNSKIQGASFALSSVAGIASMFGGQVGEAAGVLFGLTAAMTALTTVTQLLTTTQMKARAAEALVDIGGSIFKGGLKNSLINLSTVVKAALGGFSRLIPVIGVAVAAFGVFKLIVDKQEEQKKKIEGLGNTANLSAEKLKGLAETLGQTAKVIDYRTRGQQGQAPATAAETNQIQQLLENEQFAEDYAVQIQAISDATVEQAERTLQALAVQLQASGFDSAAIKAVINALAQSANRTDLNLKFASISVDGTQALPAIEDLAQDSADAFAKAFETGMSVKTFDVTMDGKRFVETAVDASDEARQQIEETAGTFKSIFDSLALGLDAGTISAEEFNGQMLSIRDIIDGMPGSVAMLRSLAVKMDINELTSGLADADNLLLAIQSKVAGVNITESDIEALRALNSPDASPRAISAGIRTRAQLTKQILDAAAAQQEFNDLQEEVLEQTMLNQQYEDAIDALKDETQSIIDKNNAYKALIDIGFDTAEALEAVANANFMAAFSAQSENIEEAAAAWREYRDAVASSVTATTGGGGGQKSVFQEAVDKLKEQRDEIGNSIAAYRGLRRAGFGVKEAFDAAKDPATALALATTKVGTSKWKELVGLINDVNEAARKSKLLDLVVERKATIGLTRAFTEITPLLSKMGLTADEIRNILGDPDLAQSFIDDLKDGEINSQNILYYLNQIPAQKKVDILFNMATPEGMTKEFDEAFSRQMEAFGLQERQLDIEFRKPIEAAEEAVSAAEEQVKAAQDSIDSLQATITEKQKEIELSIDRPIETLNEQLKDIERAIEIDYSRPIESLQEESSDLANDLALIDRQAESITKHYDDQQEALDKIVEANNNLVEQDNERLDIADAIARGDIAEAARAMRAASQAEARRAKDRAARALEVAKENQIAKIKSESGMTREQIEQRQFEISQEIYSLEEQREEKQSSIKDIQDEIYNIEQLRVPLVKEIQSLEDEIYEIQIGQLADAESLLRIAEAELDTIRKQKEERLDAIQDEKNSWLDLQVQVDAAKIGADNYLTSLEAARDMVRSIENAWKAVGTQSASANNITESSTPNIPTSSGGGGGGGGADDEPSSTSSYAPIGRPGYFPGEISGGYTWTGSSWRRLQTSGGGGAGTGLVRRAAGGLIPYMSSGGMFKPKGTDTVPAMLTPGEFVVKRSSVKEIGVENLRAMNSSGKMAGDSVYNYSVNVSVKSDAKPDDIARAVMTQIKQADAQRIRGNRF